MPCKNLLITLIQSITILSLTFYHRAAEMLRIQLISLKMQSKYLKSLQQIFTKTTVVLLHLNTLVFGILALKVPQWTPCLTGVSGGLPRPRISLTICLGVVLPPSCPSMWLYAPLHPRSGKQQLQEHGNSVCLSPCPEAWLSPACSYPKPSIYNSNTAWAFQTSILSHLLDTQALLCSEPVLDVVAAWFLGLLSSVWFPRQQRKCGVACSLAVSQLTLKSPQNGREVCFTSYC